MESKKTFTSTIIHHHLKTGGVTTIIKSQIQSIQNLPVDYSLLVGSVPEDNSNLFSEYKLAVAPELEYLYPDSLTEKKAHKLLESYIDYFTGEYTKDRILHIHNLNLGKNPVFTYAVHQIVKQGYTVFHHCHDFPEDRPANWSFLEKVICGYFGEKDLKSVLYPNVPNYFIGVLNSFDQNRLQAVLPEEKIFLLPNPVNTTFKTPLLNKSAAKEIILKTLRLSPGKQIITYPVRAIKRKNIGELILLACLFSDRAHFLITLAPQNPEEIKLYKAWKSLCRENNIKIHFGVGEKCNFETLLRSSDFCITTSIREGFGMVYLEPWLFGTPVKGRNISYITNDIINSGVKFPFLYDSIEIFMEKGIDFSDLEISRQMELIDNICQNPLLREEIIQTNPKLEKLFQPVDEELIEANRKVISNNYSLENYGQKLYDIYCKISEQTQ